MEKLGLEGVFDIAGFRKGIDEYSSKLGAAMKQTEQSEGLFGKLGNALGGAVTVGAAAAVASVAAIAGAIVGAVSAAEDWANSLDAIGDLLGTTTTESAGLKVAVERVGGNAEQFANQLVFLGKNLVGANGKLGKSGEAIAALGVNAYDANGKLRTTSAIAADVATAVAKMPDGLEKSEVLMNIFGRSGKDLSDVMTGLANGGLADATRQAQEYGLAMSDEAVQATIDSKKQIKQLEQAVNGLVVGLGTQLLPIILPIIQKLVELALSVLPQVRQGIQDVVRFIGPLVAGLGGFLDLLFKGAQTQDPLGLGNLVAGAQAAVATLGQAWGNILETIGPVIESIKKIVTVVFGTIAVFLNQHGDEIQGFIAATWEHISGIIETVSEIIKATIVPIFAFIAKYVNDNQSGLQATFELVWGAIKFIVGNALTIIEGVLHTALAILKGDWSGAWEAFKKIFVDVWASLEPIVLGVWNGIKTGVQNGINSVIDMINGLINNINDFVIWSNTSLGTSIHGLDLMARVSFAKGGIVTKPTLAMVGDSPRGPEAVAPLSDLASMLNSMQSSGGAGTGPITVNIDVGSVALSDGADQAGFLNQVADAAERGLRQALGQSTRPPFGMGRGY